MQITKAIVKSVSFLKQYDGESIYLEQWVSVKLVEKVHDGVGMQRRGADDDMSL